MESRPKRADAQRKMDAVLKAAVQVFAKSGVDATVREIAKQAGVGLGTVYLLSDNGASYVSDE